MSDHARLAPSSMRRTIACPGSVGMGAGAARTESHYAAQGTAAHRVLEWSMLLDCDPHVWLGTTIAVGNQLFTVDEDMADAVAHAQDYVRSYLARYPQAQVRLERRVYPGKAIGRDDCWGTLDISINNVPVELVILDYKHGAGIYVEVENNEQLMTYAIGELFEDLSYDYPRDMPIRLVIVQPRNRGGTAGPVREHVITIGDLIAFGKEIRAAAEESDKPDARLAAGDHCRFCPAAPRCPELAQHAVHLAVEEFSEENVRLLDPSSDRFGYLLRQVPVVTAWGAAVKTLALAHALSGRPVADHKLVRGKGSRSWHDEAAARALLVSSGFAEDSVAPRSIVSPAQAEELLKQLPKPQRKTVKEQVVPLIRKSEGGLVLAHNSDPRQPAGAASQFTDLDQEDILS